jgi:hypothetical protein
MSLEPALALLIGFGVLSQVPGLLPVAGIAFVVVAGIGAERTGARPGPEARDRIVAVRPRRRGSWEHADRGCVQTVQGRARAVR